MHLYTDRTEADVPKSKKLSPAFPAACGAWVLCTLGELLMKITWLANLRAEVQRESNYPHSNVPLQRYVFTISFLFH